MHLEPEFRLFCLALRHPQQPEDAEALRRATAASPDWNSIVAGARRHHVAPLVLAGLRSCGATEIPDDALLALRQQAIAAARRDLAQTAEIGRLMHVFADAGIRVLTLKGLALSAQLDDPFPRGSGDIDLLVGREQFAQADAALIAAGYRSRYPAQSPRQAAAYHWAIKEVTYIHTATGRIVELHDRLTSNPDLLPSNFATLWQDHAVVRVENADVLTLARHWLPLYLTVHGAGHVWERLRWLVDLTATLREPGAIETAVAAADAAGLGGAMHHALILMHDWLGLTVAAPVLSRARASARVRHLDRILAHFYSGAAWHQSPSRSSWQGIRRYSVWLRLYSILLKTNFRYWASLAKRELVTPADWGTVRLPDALFFLYSFIRPFGWLVRRWRR